MFQEYLVDLVEENVIQMQEQEQVVVIVEDQMIQIHQTMVGEIMVEIL